MQRSKKSWEEKNGGDFSVESISLILCFYFSFVIPVKTGIQFMNYYVYILASKRNGTLYIGVTSDLLKRIHQHKSNTVEGFTKKYNVHLLVYYESTSDVESALSREK